MIGESNGTTSGCTSLSILWPQDDSTDSNTIHSMRARAHLVLWPRLLHKSGAQGASQPSRTRRANRSTKTFHFEENEQDFARIWSLNVQIPQHLHGASLCLDMHHLSGASFPMPFLVAILHDARILILFALDGEDMKILS